METGSQVTTQKEPTIVERVARIISSVRGTKPDYTALAAELEPAIPFDIFGVVLLRHDREALRVTVCKRVYGSWVAHYHQHPLADSMVEQILHAPSMRVKNYPEGLDGPPAEAGDALSGQSQLRSTLIVPLVVEDRILGTLELGSARLDTYVYETLRRLIEAVARVLATAIEGVQVGGNVEIQDRQRQALKTVSNALTSTMDLTTIFDRIVAGVAESLHVASAIVILDYGEHKLHLGAQSGLDSIILREIVSDSRVLTDACIIGYTLRHRQPNVSNDIADDARFPVSGLFSTRLAVHSIFCYPLMIGTTVYGALLLFSPEPGGFTPLKADILSLFASQATIAIHNGMLLESARQRKRFQEVIEQLEQAQRQESFEDENRLFELVRHESERTFGVSFGSLLRFISDHLLTRSERNLQTLLHTAQEEQSAQNAQNQASLPLPVALQKDLYAQEGSVAFLTRTAEEALARASILSELGRLSQMHERFSDHSTDAWFAVDLKGHCIYMNPAAEGLCSVRMKADDSPLEEVFAVLLSRARNADELLAYLQAFIQEHAQPLELRCVFAAETVRGTSPLVRAQDQQDAGRQGSTVQNSMPSDRYYLFTRHSVCDQNGQLKANGLQAHDITEQVRDEKNKSVLLSSVSHDLRTPLTTIKAAVTGLLQPGVVWDEEGRREILEDIDLEADHLTVLVNALIEMSRIEMGALVLEKEWCDVVEIFSGTQRRIERVLGGRRIQTRFQESLPLIQVDYVQMEHVFYNLLENASRHSSEEYDLIVTLEAADGTLRGRVIDHGYEVPEEERERIFHTFSSLDSQGNGLGLAICRGIIEAHQGHIWVEAAPEGGACFIFTLPMYARGIAQTGSVSLSSLTVPEGH